MSNETPAASATVNRVVGQWISAAASMPPDCHDVIIYCPLFDAEGDLIVGGFVVNGEWHMFGEDASCPPYNVTHWMEYPNPPNAPPAAP
jgi:hypothetical protein